MIPDHCGLGGNATEEASLVAALVASAEAHAGFSALDDCPRCAPRRRRRAAGGARCSARPSAERAAAAARGAVAPGRKEKRE